MLTIIAALALSAAPVEDCWGVQRFDSGNVTFIDLSDSYYVEYRRAAPFTPPASVNPDNYAIHYRFMLGHDLESDEVISSTVTVEMRAPHTDEIILPPDDAEQMLSVAQIGPARTGAIATTKADWLTTRPVGAGRSVSGRTFNTPPGYPMLHAHLLAGGKVQLRYRQVYPGGTLIADTQTSFPENAANHAESRDAARQAQVTFEKTGRCPFEH